jgi:hypothetical protein
MNALKTINILFIGLSFILISCSLYGAYTYPTPRQTKKQFEAENRARAQRNRASQAPGTSRFGTRVPNPPRVSAPVRAKPAPRVTRTQKAVSTPNEKALIAEYQTVTKQLDNYALGMLAILKKTLTPTLQKRIIDLAHRKQDAERRLTSDNGKKVVQQTKQQQQARFKKASAPLKPIADALLE